MSNSSQTAKENHDSIVDFLKGENDKLKEEKVELTKQIIYTEGEKAKIQALYNQDIENWGKYRISSDEKETKMKANQEKMFAMLKNCDTDSEMNKVNDLRKLCQTYSDQIEEYKTTHAQEKNRLASENSSLSQEVKSITIENQECLKKAKDSGDIAQELERQLLDV